MPEKINNPEQLNWKLPIFIIAGAIVAFLALIAYSAYGDLLYLFLVAPITCLITFGFLLRAVLRKRPGQCISITLALIAFLVLSGTLLINRNVLRTRVRWLVWSRQFKVEVLSQPPPLNGQFQHTEWETTGFAGIANNTAYLVFDPTDSLSSVHSAIKPKGIPCIVPVVRRLEKHWYSVEFYTDESWDKCGSGSVRGR